MKEKSTIILLLLALSQFLVVLDSAIITVALPAIKDGLNFDASGLQWVVTAYVLTFGGFLMLGGRTADLFGRRNILVAGMAGFTLFSLLIGLAQSSEMIIAMRALQGLAAAFMSPAALSILLTTFSEGHERNKALAVWSMVASGGAAAGVFLGGLLTQYMGWRWNFFVNVPIGLITLFGIIKFVPLHTKEESDKHLDLPGAVLVTTGLMSLVYALTEASKSGWTSGDTLLPFGLSILLLVGFVFNETKVKHPLVPLSIFRIRNVTGANLIMLPVVAGALGVFYFTSLYIQNILHYTPLIGGASFLPIPIIIFAVSKIAPKLLGKYGFKPLLIVGTSLVALAMIILSTLGIDSSYWLHILPAFILIGVGMGLSFVSITVAATTGVPAHESGLASGLINTSNQVGAALGIAVLAVVASSVTAGALGNGALEAAATLQGYQYAFATAAGLIAIGLLVAIFVLKNSATKATPSASVH
jgi:EmrB/QacA subfamily drug resistance transporter